MQYKSWCIVKVEAWDEEGKGCRLMDHYELRQEIKSLKERVSGLRGSL
ncbi:MAG: hypothetical protein BSOLF_0851 [Candidatus Carbobacillus altaicus]|uniref:Uncharacterized protein n=1 Tax=Candidatus Carbonibacillus altaicus TaxID=2163959 RepID=A0A2R6Y064_9BACL|nr:MAG: hypothetical protein BSOLF_0851 [Candidatus Carbobacillus altaicus]